MNKLNNMIISWIYSNDFCCLTPFPSNLSIRFVLIDTRLFGCHTPLNKLIAETNNTMNLTIPLTTRVIVDYEDKNYKVEFDHMQMDRVDLLTMK